MAESEHVVAFRSSTLPEAEMVLELLRGEGIAARLIRPQGTLAGAALNLYETRIEVPAASAPRSAELLAELEVLGSSEEMDRGEDASAPPHPSPHRPVIAAGMGLLCPSGCHLYARRPWTALVVALAFLAALVVRAAASAAHPLLTQFSFVMMLAVVASDLAGGLWAIRSAKRGGQPSRSSQVGRGLVLVAGAMAVAAGVTAVVDAPRRARDRLLARFSVTCVPGAIQIVNDSDDRRFVKLEATIAPFPLPESYADRRLHVTPSSVVLDAHARTEVPFSLLGSVRATCAAADQAQAAGGRAEEPASIAVLFDIDHSPAGAPITRCALWTHLELEPDAALGLDRIEATGGCLPRWDESGWTAPVPLHQMRRR